MIQAPHRPHAFLTAALFFVAFLLLLFVSVSLPIFKPVYLFTLNGVTNPSQPETIVATEIRFGIWGLCATNVFDQPTLFTNNGECSPPALGYGGFNITTSILQLTGNPQLGNAVLQGALVILILHPIGAVLSFITLCTSLFLHSHPLAIISLVIGIITAIFTTISAVVDITLIAVARQRVPGLSIGTFTVNFGNAPWMILAGAILTWLGVIVLSAVVCNCCGAGNMTVRGKRGWKNRRF